MVHKRVTMQEIADACGLSRNTVSKVFNSRGAVPEATRRFVLEKASELGYVQMVGPVPSAPSGANIAVLTHSSLKNNSFSSTVVSSFTDQISRSGANLKMYEVSAYEMEKKELPPFLHPEELSGILCIELFDKDYLEMLCSLGVPLVCIDAFASFSLSQMRCDFVSMENLSSSFILTRGLVAKGARRIGFVGDISHCYSFFERYSGYLRALQEGHVPYDEELCILANDSEPYGDYSWYLKLLGKMPSLPDAFVCANDFIAINLMTALKRKGVSIPKEIMVVGFDGTPESEVSVPSLTTAYIPGADIGRSAAEKLLARIQDPELPYSNTFLRTTPIFRESSR